MQVISFKTTRKVMEAAGHREGEVTKSMVTEHSM
jgi:hypothetical protein